MHPTEPLSWPWPGVVKALLIASSLLLAGWTLVPIEPHRAEFYALGTRIEVQIRDPEATAESKAQVQAALRAVNTDFQHMHHDWHPWEPGAMADLNAGLQSGEWTLTTPDLIELTQASQRLETSSGGHFNAAIGQLVSLWGFHTSDYPITAPPPEPDQINAWLTQAPSTQQINVDGLKVQTDNASIQLDFSGLAKGLAVRKACERLAEFGFTDALVNAGGDVMICGKTGTPWRVAIADPEGGVLTTLELAEPVAVFTSGNYYRYGEWNGERYAHILDPRTGRPVDDILQVSILHPDPVLADAAATALVVAGSEQWQQTAEQMAVQRGIIIDAEGNVVDYSN